MHTEAYNGFGDMLALSGVDPEGSWKILDIGGQNVNGSVHEYFSNATITTLDLENADIIADGCTWRSDDRFDLVIATEVFEHVEEWPAIIETMYFHLVDGGTLISTCASTGRRPHGATGALDPAPGEWYGNVAPQDLQNVLNHWFVEAEVHYHPVPWGDAYMWARKGQDPNDA